jgi:hypothetical protein
MFMRFLVFGHSLLIRSSLQCRPGLQGSPATRLRIPPVLTTEATFPSGGTYDQRVYVRSESVSLRHIAAHAAVTTGVSLAALLLSNAVAVADPPPPVPPQEPGLVGNAAAEEQPREEEPAENTDCDEWCEVIQAAQELPPPDFSGVGVPPLAEVSVPVSFGIGLPDLVPDFGIPITVGMPQLPPAPKFELPPPPKFGPPRLPF